jgi:MoaA/NifB/PqqE/SkfB family radical SAM enzyme
MPFGHVAIESNGDIRPCCLGHPLKNDDGTTLNIGTGSIADVIKHPTHAKFRESFSRNEQHNACEPCWGVNSKDKFSGRYVYSSSSKVNDFVLEIMAGKKPEQKLIWLEIKAGNRCNLACRICGLWNSAKWLKETYNLKQSRSNFEKVEFKDSPEFAYNQQAKWIDNIEFWRNVDMLDNVSMIHIMGGEPLMIEEHFEMLSAIIEKFDASKIWVWYNTNGTIVPTPEQEAILDKFAGIHWSLSIDDFGDKFDYQRSGAEWNDVKNNLEYFFSKPNYLSTIDATVNIFNIATMDEFIKVIDDLGFITSFTPHYVTTNNSPNNVRTLSADIKKKITDHLTVAKNTINAKHHGTIDDILVYMNGIDLHDEQIDDRRKEEIDFIDKSRNESFVTTFPKMARLLNYE